MRDSSELVQKRELFFNISRVLYLLTFCIIATFMYFVFSYYLISDSLQETLISTFAYFILITIIYTYFLYRKYKKTGI